MKSFAFCAVPVWDFANIFLKSLENSWGNSYKEFVALDISAVITAANQICTETLQNSKNYHLEKGMF